MRPPILAKHRPVLDDVFIGGEEDLELPTQLILQLPTSIWGSFVRDDLEHWHPFGKLKRPVHECRQGHNDKIRPSFTLAFEEESDERDGLDSLADYTKTNEIRDTSRLQIGK